MAKPKDRVTFKPWAKIKYRKLKCWQWEQLIPPPPPRPPHRILVVEDDGDIRHLNTAVLTQSGYHVDAAKDGAEAWDHLQVKTYDLLVTDNEMPKVTGIELLKKLHAAQMPLPAIMATGTLPHDEFDRHPHIRPAVLLLKPYTIEELLEKVKEIFKNMDGGKVQSY